MSYKQNKNPFSGSQGPAGFRNPRNKGTSNFNALEFQMPDFEDIINKTADGETVTEDKTNDDRTGTPDEGKVDGTPVKGSIDALAERGTPSSEKTNKDLRKEKREKATAISRDLKEQRKKIKASTFTDKQQERINKREERRINKEADKFEKFREKGRLGEDDRTAEKLRQQLKPKAKMDSRKAEPINVGMGDRMTKVMMDEQAEKVKQMDKEGKQGTFSNVLRISNKENVPMDRIKTADGASSASWNKSGGPFNDADEQYDKRKMQMIQNPLGRGVQMNKDMKQVNSKGKGFPMVNPQQDPIGNPEPTPPAKGTMQMGGRPLNSGMLTNDPNNMLDPSKVSAQRENTAQQFSTIASSAGTPTPQYNPYQTQMQGQNQMQGMSMHHGPSKALVGDQDKLPDHLKQAIEAAPGMYNAKGPSSFDSLVKKLQSEGKSKEAATKIAGKVANMKMKGAGSGPTAAQKARSKGAGMHSMDHAHTKVTSKNLRATEKDDAAHMDYLKRDVDYDAKHGGSDRQMTDDEKHISKLAGDLKYDKKMHGRKYDNV